MAILTIYTFPSPVLREVAKPVLHFDESIKTLTDSMLETMYDAPGVGLAANQVGVTQRILVLDVEYSVEGETEKDRKIVNPKPYVFINPVILERSGKVVFKEGCLSVPGYTEDIKRAANVKLKFQDVAGKEHELEADGLLAIAIQHEIDHLDGKLFIDRLSPIKKSLIKGKIKKERNAHFERSRFKVEL